MSKYYEYVLKSIKGMKLVASTTNDIEDPTDEEMPLDENEHHRLQLIRNIDWKFTFMAI